MGTRLPGFKGEYLWELDIADRRLSALAEAFPAERYEWRSAETARSVSEILVKTITDKPVVIALLRRSLDAVRATFTQTPDTELERQDVFFGERTTVRRVYMRALSHMHEHMGQLVGYTRAMGLAAPWPDWRRARTEDHRTVTEDFLTRRSV